MALTGPPFSCPRWEPLAGPVQQLVEEVCPPPTREGLLCGRAEEGGHCEACDVPQSCRL